MDETSDQNAKEPDLSSRTYLLVLGLAVVLYVLMGWFTSVFQVRENG